jgi:hypothetical protein
MGGLLGADSQRYLIQRRPGGSFGAPSLFRLRCREKGRRGTEVAHDDTLDHIRGVKQDGVRLQRHDARRLDFSFGSQDKFKADRLGIPECSGVRNLSIRLITSKDGSSSVHVLPLVSST